MAKRPARLRKISDAIGQEREVIEQIARLLRDANFRAMASTGRDRGIDLIAERVELGRIKRYAIEVKVSTKPIGVEVVRNLLGILSDHSSLKGMSEIWMVAGAYSPGALVVADKYPQVRLLTFEDFERALAPPKLPEMRTRSARSTVAKAILINQAQIATTSAALTLLIDERLAALQQERPNSSEARSQKDADIAQYEQLKQDVVAISTAATEFSNGKIKEAEVLKASKTFADGVRSWWTKSHHKICDKAFDMSIFLSAVGICSMVGSGGQMAVVVSAALVGGKPIVGVLKEVAKKMLKD